MYTGFGVGGGTEGSRVVCDVVLIGTWLPLFGQSCGSCTMKLDTVSCYDMEVNICLLVWRCVKTFICFLCLCFRAS